MCPLVLLQASTQFHLSSMESLKLGFLYVITHNPHELNQVTSPCPCFWVPIFDYYFFEISDHVLCSIYL